MINLEHITQDKELQEKLNQAIDLVEEKKYWELIDNIPAFKWVEKYKLHNYIQDESVIETDELL